MKKRKVALVFLVLVAALVAATLAALRTRWAGEKLCGLASARLAEATGLEVRFGACRIDPLGLAVEVDQVALHGPGGQTFAADAVRARLAPFQALGRRLHLDELRLVRPRLRADLSGAGGGAGGACPPPFLQRFELHRLDVEEGAVALVLPGGGALAVGRLDVRSTPGEGALRALATPVRTARLSLAAADVSLTTAARRLAAPTIEAEGEVALDLSSARVAALRARVEGLDLTASGRVDDLCAPALALEARVEGPVGAMLALGGFHPETAGTAVLEARLEGPLAALAATGTVRTRGVRIDHYRLGDAEGQARLAGGVLRLTRGVIPGEGGGAAVLQATLRLGAGLPIEGEVDFADADLAELLERLGIPDAWITVKLAGKGKIAGGLWPPDLAATWSGDVTGFKALTRSFHVGAGDAPVLGFPRGKLDARFRIDRRAITFEETRLTVGRGTLACDASVRFAVEEGFEARCAGGMDLSAAGKLAEVPWAGLADVEARVAAAPYGNPRIDGRARVAGFRFLEVDLGDVATDFTYDDFLLRLAGAEGVRNASRYRGEGVVDLSAMPVRVVSSRLEASGRLRDMFDAVIDWLPRTRYVRDVMDGSVELAGTARGPVDALDCDFDARLGPGTVFRRGYESGRLAGAILRGEVVRYDRAELRRGTGIARLTGTWGTVPPFRWDLEASFAGVPMAELDLPGRWDGSASGSAALAGSYEHPRVRFAMNGDGVTLEGMRLGTVQAGGTITERHLVLTGGAEGVDFAGELELAGALPFRARATVALDEAQRLWPGGPPAGLRARLAGSATAEGVAEDLARVRATARLATLELSYADLRIEAAAPAELTVANGRVALAPLTLRGARTELTLSGAAARGGALDVDAAGTVDLALLGGVIPALRKPHGQLAVDAHLGGTLEQPALVGSGRITDGGFQVRGATAALGSVRGTVAFSQDRVLFEGLTGEVNGGAVRMKGEVELARLLPSRFAVEAQLADVPLLVPPALPVTLRGTLTAGGTPEAATLGGLLHVARARYTADVDLEGSLLAVRRRPPPPPRAYDKAGEWLRFDVALVVDGDARVDNDLVRGPLAGELTLSGTLAAPGLVGTLAMGEGSRLVFRGNEFTLTHAVLEFTDRHTIDIALDVHGQSQVRDYEILMHVFGSLQSPEVSLTSVPSLPQPDIVTLLSLGFTRRDAGAGTGVSGVATAAAAQALFSASGLDEQVRRFLPRGGPIRDLNMRITSAYSEETGQVEPRAEFESWVLRDRLRLRFQAPLGGARGRKAQAELRLGAHTAVQYQWDNDNPDVSTGDHGVDLKLRWEWTDEP